MVLVPPSLASVDPSFASELRSGFLGIAGRSIHVGSHSPYDVELPTHAARNALLAFEWLAHLGSTDDVEAIVLARRHLQAWWHSPARRSAAACLPEVVARRVMALMAAAGFMLDGAAAEFYRSYFRELDADLQVLYAACRSGLHGEAVIMCHAAASLASLSFSGGDRQLARFESALLRGLERQVLPDGGHVSRNPQTVLEFVHALLPLRQCYVARHLAVPDQLNDAVESMLGFLKAMRLGDGGLAVFNGPESHRAASLGTVLAFSPRQGEPTDDLGASGYRRLERAGTVLIMDCASPPPIDYGATTRAGCLALEVSDGAEIVLANAARALDDGNGRQRRLARTTASHNTLVLAAQSSGEFVESGIIERLFGDAVLKGPDRVSVHVATDPAVAEIEASHDGYHAAFQLIHTRRVELSSDGLRLSVVDRLAPLSGILRLRRDLPFAIYLHPGQSVTMLEHADDGTVELQLASGHSWRLSASEVTVAIERVHAAVAAGTRTPLRQIVLRGSCPGESRVRWVLEKQPGRRPPARSDPIWSEALELEQ